MYRRAIHQLQRLIEQARRAGVQEPTAAALATADARGQPSLRMVLLKAVDEHGVVFYTNLKSRKGRQLSANPRAALCCFWDALKEQALIEGRVRRVSDREADAYWATRPRMAQLGAWASLQSQLLASRTVLAARIAAYAARFAGRPVPRPPHWSGYRVIPERIEFWSPRAFRLNERILYSTSGRGWTKQLLYP